MARTRRPSIANEILAQPLALRAGFLCSCYSRFTTACSAALLIHRCLVFLFSLSPLCGLSGALQRGSAVGFGAVAACGMRNIPSGAQEHVSRSARHEVFHTHYPAVGRLFHPIFSRSSFNSDMSDKSLLQQISACIYNVRYTTSVCSISQGLDILSQFASRYTPLTLISLSSDS